MSVLFCGICFSIFVFCLILFFLFLFFFFFFSSRRRHTRCLSDWSSDVCSSDLDWPRGQSRSVKRRRSRNALSIPFSASDLPATADRNRVWQTIWNARCGCKIGRASCRERV